MSPTTSKARARNKGRPTSEQSQRLDENVKQAAIQLFMDQGYDAVSMEAVAKAAGITKRSLYARYKDKITLFADVLRWTKTEWTDQDQGTDVLQNATLEQQLEAIGNAMLEQALTPRYLKIARIASLKAEDLPQEVRQNFDMSFSPRIKAISRVLDRHRQRGDIELENLELAAELFIGLVTGVPVRMASMGIVRPAEVERARVRYAVEVFVNGLRRRR